MQKQYIHVENDINKITFIYSTFTPKNTIIFYDTQYILSFIPFTFPFNSHTISELGAK